MIKRVISNNSSCGDYGFTPNRQQKCAFSDSPEDVEPAF